MFSRPNNNVEDLVKRGYGTGWDITWLFLGLARAAGLQADPVIVSTRNLYFFSPALMNAVQLNSNVVVVNLNGKDFYLDPGAKFTPFGMLPWTETGARRRRTRRSAAVTRHHDRHPAHCKALAR